FAMVAVMVMLEFALAGDIAEMGVAFAPLLFHVPIARDVHALIPVVLYEVHRPPACMVVDAMIGPVVLIARRYVQVDGRPDRTCLDDHGCRINHRWRCR